MPAIAAVFASLVMMLYIVAGTVVTLGAGVLTYKLYDLKKEHELQRVAMAEYVRTCHEVYKQRQAVIAPTPTLQVESERVESEPSSENAQITPRYGPS